MSASRTLLFVSLLMCYIITLTSNLIGTETDWFLSFLLPIFDCWLLSLLAGLLNKIKLGIVVSIPVVAILFSELLTVFFYHSNFTIYVILLLFETNVQESTEFVHAALAHPGTWYAVAITILDSEVHQGTLVFLRGCTRIDITLTRTATTVLGIQKWFARVGASHTDGVGEVGNSSIIRNLHTDGRTTKDGCKGHLTIDRIGDGAILSEEVLNLMFFVGNRLNGALLTGANIRIE